MAKAKSDLLERLVPVLLVASLLLAFAVGMLWQKVSNLESGTTAAAGGTTANAGNGAAAPTTDPNQAAGQGLTQLGKLSADQTSKIPPVTDKDHIRGGDANTKVKLVEYGDFQCPYCAQFHPTAQQVMKDYAGKVAWVYRNFPLTQIHPYAMPAANAAECVNALGGNDAFWKFADEVFPNQNKYLTDLSAAATAVGINASQFKACDDAKKYQSVIDADQKGGTDAGVTGTPAIFVINDKNEAWFIPGALPYAQVKPIIDQAIQGS